MLTISRTLALPESELVERFLRADGPGGQHVNRTESAVDKAVVSIGYSSWSKGQLERELAGNSWLTVPADTHILFDLPYAERYQAALAKLGIEQAGLMSGAGHA